MARRTRIALGFGLAVLVLVLDQVSKALVLHAPVLRQGGSITLVPGILNAVFTWNVGITFGMFRYSFAWIVLIPVALAVIVALVVWLVKAEHARVSCAVGAILGGAVGNVIDRMQYGKVVDFLHLHLGAFDPFPYIFNVGDSAIVLGVAALLLDMALSGSTERNAAGE
ncbi:MAG TPA: signal peptidase II [Acetobacteraceae bacterium]|nr:signal peptidase II [Acetobacteraceae bacterium]